MNSTNSLIVVLFMLITLHVAPGTLGDELDSGDGCYMEGITLKVGESTPSSKGCYKITCVAHNSYVGKACGSMNLPEGSPCTMTTDKSKPYPDCCPEVKCPDKK